MMKPGNNKRWIYSLPARLGWTVLVVICLLGFFASAIGAVCFDRVPVSKEDGLQEHEQLVAENYSAYLLSQLREDGKFSDLSELKNTNFNYAVVKSSASTLEDVDLQKEENYLAGSPADAANYKYVFEGQSGKQYFYNLENLGQVLLGGDHPFAFDDYGYGSDTAVLKVEDIVYSEKSGLFYLKTAKGYFRASRIRIDGSKEYDLEQGSPEETELDRFVEINEDGGILTGYYDKEFSLKQEKGSYSYVADNGDIFDLSMDLDSCTLYIMDQEENCLASYRLDSQNGRLIVSEDSEGDIRFETVSDENSIKENLYANQEYSFYSANYLVCKRDSSEYPYYYVLSWVNDPLDTTLKDGFTEGIEFLNFFYGIGYSLIWLQVVFAVLTIVFFALYLLAVGHRPGDDEIHLTVVDRIPFELLTLICLCLGGTICACYSEVLSRMTAVKAIAIISTETITVCAVICMTWLSSLIVRIKGHCFWHFTLVRYLAAPILHFLNYLKKISKGEEMFARNAILLILTLDFAEIFLFVLCLEIDITAGFFWVIISVVLQSLALICLALQIQKLRKGTRLLAEGNTEEKIDTSVLKGPFKAHGEDINRISDNISIAVSRQLKSEHLRTELITNVSHDIKTPLTSIINYVDLIKKEEIADPKLLNYVEVLDRQSGKLKKLIQDLIDASKASTGNLEVNLEPTDAAVLLSQAIGEFEERLESKRLSLVVDSPEPPVEILADGRHLWRVFDNLLENICKYAMPGTRVYITLCQEKDETRFIFRNISAEQLNIGSEELMERFVRGDGSRTTEGNGLGLSIAQSLMRLMGGEMELDIDGDLFKATLRF